MSTRPFGLESSSAACHRCLADLRGIFARVPTNVIFTSAEIYDVEPQPIQENPAALA
jgi:hypothetical protein